MIKATIPPHHPNANMGDYDAARKAFSWDAIRTRFTHRPDGRVNIVHDAVDRWADDPSAADRPALIFERAGEISRYTYRDMKRISCQWAHLLTDQGFGVGDRLFFLLPPCPEIYFAMLACARAGVVFCPLFSSLNYDELEERIVNARPRGVLTHPDLAEGLPAEAMEMVARVFYIKGPLPGFFSGEVDLKTLPNTGDRTFETRWLPPDAPLYLLYTSGSTGPPKGVVHAHRDMAGQWITARYALDLSEGTVLWTDCDPAWVTGAVYGAFAPWLCGAASVVQGDPFSASTWYRTLERHRVEVWYKTPGTMRRLMAAGDDLTGRYDLSALRHIPVVGEALAPEILYWFKQHFGITPHDTWWMTETGMICIANFPSMAVKPGSMGRPVPGVEAAVIDESGAPLPPMSLGELALRPGWPAMMTEIWLDPERYAAYFRLPGWFRTGDMVLMDHEGYYYHQGRMDDLFKVGVKLIGPYEIERALCRHPAVGEAAVISRSGRPGEPVLKAFITVNEGVAPSTRLNAEIRAFVQASLSPEIRLREIDIIDQIPRTRSGKLLRRALRMKERGLPVGDPANIND